MIGRIIAYLRGLIANMNLIQNPDYTGNGEGWTFHAEGGGSFVVDAKTAVLSVAGASNNIQFYQAGLTLKPWTRYRLAFSASASDGSDMSVFLHKHNSPYTNYGLTDYIVELSAEMKEVEVYFTTPGQADAGRLRFWFAPFAKAGTVYRLANVSLEEATEPEPEPEPEPDPEPEPEPEPQPDPPGYLARQLSVIVRDIPPGGWHEVRHVRPSELVVVNGNIDWTQTPYSSFILEGVEDEADD